MGRRGATLTELIVTMSVVAIIAAVSAGIITYLIQIFVYLPREMKARTVAQEIMATVIEGEPDKRGLRYAVVINTVTRSATQDLVNYTFGYPAVADTRRVQIRWARQTGNEGRILRSYSDFGQTALGTEEAIPYYTGGDTWVNRNASPQAVFRYYDVNGNELTPSPNLNATQRNSVRRIEITLGVKVGTGLFDSWGSTYTTTSSVEIKQYP